METTNGVLENKELGIALNYWQGSKKNQRVFVGKQIGEQFGHTNINKARKDCHLEKGIDYVLVTKKEFPEFFNQLSNLTGVGSRAASIIMVYESGVNLLMLGSKLEIGVKVKRWMAREVLPSLQLTGTYDMRDSGLLGIREHTNRDTQVQNSKDVNSANYVKGGVPEIIDYNRKSCVAFTGLTPSKIKKAAKKNGLPSKIRKSAKEVIRHTQPAKACAMSFTDSFVKKGADFRETVSIAKNFMEPAFNWMLNQGFTPAELKG